MDTDAEGFGTAFDRVFYIDNIEVNALGACDSETTESMSAADLNMTFMSDQTANIRNDNATFEYVANPDFDKVNSSCFVGKVTKSAVNTWDNNQIYFNSKFDLSANGGFKIKVYSANPGYTVLLKLESIVNPSLNTEIDLTTTKTNEWEELTFNFSTTHDNKYDKIVLIFDLSSASTNTYYFDDLKLFERTTGGGGGTGTSNTIGGGDGCDDTTTCPNPPSGELLYNGNFEACDCDWQLIGNGGTVSISETINNGGSRSAKIQSAPGINSALKQERLGVGIIQPNTTYVVTFDIKASGVFGEGGVFKAFVFSTGENGGDVGATQHVLTDNTASISSTTWESKSYTFTTPGNANQVAGGVTFLAELVNSNASVNIDNVVLKIK